MKRTPCTRTPRTRTRPLLPGLSRPGRWLLVLLAVAGLAAGGAGCKSSKPGRLAGPYRTRPPVTDLTRPGETLSPEVDEFFVGWAYHHIEVGDTLKGRLIAVDVGGVAPAGTVVLEPEFKAVARGEAYGIFTFRKPTAGWPKGKYRIEGYFKGTQRFDTLDFEVR